MEHDEKYARARAESVKNRLDSIASNPPFPTSSHIESEADRNAVPKPNQIRKSVDSMSPFANQDFSLNLDKNLETLKGPDSIQQFGANSKMERPYIVAVLAVSICLAILYGAFTSSYSAHTDKLFNTTQTAGADSFEEIEDSKQSSAIQDLSSTHALLENPLLNLPITGFVHSENPRALVGGRVVRIGDPIIADVVLIAVTPTGIIGQDGAGYTYTKKF